MTTYFLLGFALIFLVWGLFFLYKVFKPPVEQQQQTAVPIYNTEEINELRNEFENTPSSDEAQSESRAPNLTQHMLNENLKSTNEPVGLTSIGSSDDNQIKILQDELELTKKKLTKLTQESQLQNEQLTVENQRLNEALQQERSSTDVGSEDQQKLIAAQQEEIQQLTASLDKFIAVSQKFDDLFHRTAEIEKKFGLIIKQKEDEANQLKNQVRQLENQPLQSEEKNEQDHAKEIESYTQQISALKDQLLKREQSSDEEAENKLIKMQADIDKLLREKQDALEVSEKLQEDYKMLKVFNEQLLEKEHLLQYELSKHRAQALGLEKICEDFQVKLNET